MRGRNGQEGVERRATAFREKFGRASSRKIDDDPDALDDLLERYHAGLLEPESVELPVELLPPRATMLRALAGQIALWMGLRLAVFEYRPMPISQRFIARKMDWRLSTGESDRDAGRRALKALVRYGVLVPGEPMPRRGGWEGTRTFLPPEPLAVELGFAHGDDAVEGEPVVVEGPVGEPASELEEEPGVDGAGSGVLAVLDDVRMATGGVDTAELWFGHDRNATPTDGRLPFITPPPWASNDTAPSGIRSFDVELQP